MSGASSFSADYFAARERFRNAVRSVGGRDRAHAIAASGPGGETLTIDIAVLGDPRPERSVVLSSALHGVEGFLGSAVQLAWLDALATGAASLPARVAVILVHAINPFGFAWLRRTNESNVDLNRNFVEDWRAQAEDADLAASWDAYQRFDRFLNPRSPPSRWEPFLLEAARHILAQGVAARRRMAPGDRPPPASVAAVARLGLRELTRTLPVGQYRNAEGLFYGGSEAEASSRILARELPLLLTGVARVVHVDFHSGLGRWGEYGLYLIDERESARARWMMERFADHPVVPIDAGVPYRPHGTMAGYFRARLASYHGVLAEFGTCSSLRVLEALRAENRAHFHANHDTPAYRRAKAKLREAFCPADEAWRRTVVERGLRVACDAVLAVSRH